MSGGPDAGRLLVTNDGATILSKIGIDNPVAKVLVGAYQHKKKKTKFFIYFFVVVVKIFRKFKMMKSVMVQHQLSS